MKTQIKSVSKTFGSDRRQVQALQDVSLVVDENEFVSVVGTSGCGKSTLLSIVAGLQHPTTGTVLVADKEIRGPGRDRGVVVQNYTLFPWLTAKRNIEFALRETGTRRKEASGRASEALGAVGLGEFEDAYPSELSGGMKQRVAIARALSYRPRILLMDEPFGALDALTRRLMQELLTGIWERDRLTVLFITHDVSEAVYLSDRVVVMTNRPGRIKEEIRIDLPRPRTEAVTETAEFGHLQRQVLDSIRVESLSAEHLAAKSPL